MGFPEGASLKAATKGLILYSLFSFTLAHWQLQRPRDLNYGSRDEVFSADDFLLDPLPSGCKYQHILSLPQSSWFSANTGNKTVLNVMFLAEL